MENSSIEEEEWIIQCLSLLLIKVVQKRFKNLKSPLFLVLWVELYIYAENVHFISTMTKKSILCCQFEYSNFLYFKFLNQYTYF